MEAYYKAIVYILGGILGLCVGSFLNVVIYRLPLKMSLSRPNSHCPRCKHALAPYENIPVISYIFLGGRCKSCKTHIPFRYTAVELLNALLWLLCIFLFWEKSIALACIYALALTVFICVFFIDLEHKMIFDRFQIILLVLATVSIFFDGSVKWYSHIIGAIAGFGVFYLIALAFEKIFKKEALGGGDIKLAGVAGLLLGWEKLLLGLLLASIPAAIIMLIASRREKSKDKEYPFAPFLTFGFAVALLFGSQIIELYLSLLGI